VARVGITGGKRQEDKFFYERTTIGTITSYLVYREKPTPGTRGRNWIASARNEGERSWIATSPIDPTLIGHGESRFSAVMDILQQVGESS
jgi:hypothetical protein